VSTFVRQSAPHEKTTILDVRRMVYLPKRHGEAIRVTGSFGFIHEKLEIKILILFVMRHLREPAAFSVLTELVMCDDGISYFDFAESVAELVKTEHLRLENNKYSITQKGVKNGETTESSLPYSVRVKAEERVSSYRAAQIRNALINTSHVPNPEGGCSVMLSLSDGVGEIVALQLFAVNDKHARGLENGFRKNAEAVYNSLLGAILS